MTNNLAIGSICLATLSLLTLERASIAHDGRGFVVEVTDGQLQGQGVNNGDFDGAPAVRPYLNSIHDHWSVYVPSLDRSFATFPEFEVTPQVAFSFLESYALQIELVSAWQWQSPPSMPAAGTTPDLRPLDPNDVITIQTLGAPISTDTLGTLQLSTSVPAGGTGDIVPNFSIQGSPTDRIYVLEFVMSATAPDTSHPEILPSDPMFLLLSPDGVGPVERLHHASLYLEEYLALHGLAVPEPDSFTLAALGLVVWSRRRRSRKSLV